MSVNETKPTDRSDCQPSASCEASLRKYGPLVDRVLAREMRRLPSCVDRGDLRAAGMAALFSALRSSVHANEDMFVAYAKIRIRGAIMDELRRLDWSPRRRKVAPDATTEQVPIRMVGIADLTDPDSQIRPSTAPASPLDEVIARRNEDALRAAVGALPEREAEVVRLRYFEDMPSKDIAAAMRVSEARVSQINASATRKLRALLEQSEREAA